MRTVWVHNIGRLVTPQGKGPARGEAMREVEVYPNAWMRIVNGVIDEIRTDGVMPDGLPADVEIVDAGGCMMTPGLIDPHTHLVFGGYRQHEAAMRAQGADYMEILRAGGGILDTVRRTRTEPFDALYAKAAGFAWEMLARGVTACEAKSGYGLDIDTEIKQLRVAQAVSERLPMDVVLTYLGAHATPPEYVGTPEVYVQFLIERAIPAVAAEKLAAFCDVFCEKGVFDMEQSRRILRCAKAHGMRPKLHADEIEPMGGGTLAAEMGAISADHLIAVSDESIEALAASETVAVLLPQTSLYLGKPYAPGRKLIDAGVPVALATDFNPGSCPSINLHLSMTLGFLKYRMTPEEVLCAVTRNAACAIGMDDQIGTLEPGKQADFVLWDAEDMAMVCYRMGANLVRNVYKRGERVVSHDE